MSHGVRVAKFIQFQMLFRGRYKTAKPETRNKNQKPKIRNGTKSSDIENIECRSLY